MQYIEEGEEAKPEILQQKIAKDPLGAWTRSRVGWMNRISINVISIILGRFIMN